jgi:hypothetical protein
MSAGELTALVVNVLVAENGARDTDPITQTGAFVTQEGEHAAQA